MNPELIIPPIILLFIVSVFLSWKKFPTWMQNGFQGLMAYVCVSGVLLIGSIALFYDYVSPIIDFPDWEIERIFTCSASVTMFASKLCPETSQFFLTLVALWIGYLGVWFAGGIVVGWLWNKRKK